MNKVNINLIHTQEEFEQARKEFIKNKTEENLQYPELYRNAEQDAHFAWEQTYPNYETWRNSHILTAVGQQRVIDALNELMDEVVSLKKNLKALDKKLKDLEEK